jgi:YVTN family beta-propeller protein
MTNSLIGSAAAVLLSLSFLTGPAKAEEAMPGLPAIQRPFAKLPRVATFPVATLDSDWVAIAPDAVWVAGKGPDIVRRIDAATNTETASAILPGAACAGLAFGFDSLWVPICGTEAYSVVRIDNASGRIIATVPMGPPAEGGIAAGKDAVWFVVDGSTLVAIDPTTNAPTRRIAIPAGSHVPIVNGDTVWVTSTTENLVTAVNAATGEVIGTTPTGPKPHFLAAGDGSVWTLNQGDGTVTRIDAATRQVTATIPLGLARKGGDIAYDDGLLVVTQVGVPITAIDAKSDKPLVQWVGPGGDSLRVGHGAIWLTDYLAGTLIRIDPKAAAGGKSRK